MSISKLKIILPVGDPFDVLALRPGGGGLGVIGIPIMEPSAGLSADDITYDAYLTSLAPLLDLRMNIASGTNIPNYGSLGSAQDGTLTLGAGALQQTSPLGAGEAISWDALDTKILVTAPAAIFAAPILTWVFFHRINSAGENNNACFFSFSNSAAALGQTAATKNIAVKIPQATTTAASTTNVDFIEHGVWQMNFFTYNDNTDKTIRIYKGINGAVIEATYAIQTAGVGALGSATTSLNLGNRLNNDLTWDGLFSRIAFIPAVLTPAQMLQLTLLAGLT
jgi:hypothetical protein